ncbi:hypothetical protein, partial [Enterobacter cloacae]|uniref:hypothetical protein n=1 Tax=Enterobacter cloacae TaxID=550 RepID=UPI0013D71827
LAMNTQFGDGQDAKAEARESTIGAVTASRAKAGKTSPAAEMVLNVRPDPIDFRDLFYEPTLVAIKPQLYPPPLEALG